MAEITGLLLAAGGSSRFGTNKLTAPLNGRALVLHSIYALAPCDRILAVVREEDVYLQRLLQAAGIDVVVNTQASRGMGNSIACGVHASGDSDGWCILPADMPCVSTATTARVVKALREGATLAAPFYQQRRGHPVGFGKTLAPLLATLDGDSGAREIVAQHAAAMRRLDTDDAGVLLDIDTVQDLSQLTKQKDCWAK